MFHLTPIQCFAYEYSVSKTIDEVTNKTEIKQYNFFIFFNEAH